MNKNFFKSDSGDTNIVSLLIILIVTVVLVLLFKGYISDLFSTLFH